MTGWPGATPTCRCSAVTDHERARTARYTRRVGVRGTHARVKSGRHYCAWLTEDMWKSGIRSDGMVARVAQSPHSAAGSAR